MPRRRVAEKRRILPDPVYNDVVVAKLINDLMVDGKKGVAEGIVYKSFSIIDTKMKEDPIKVFRKAVENIQPLIEVKPRRVGGSTYQVPVEIRPERRLALALRWLVNYSRQRPGKTMEDRLAAEVMDAVSGRGSAVKKREDVHKMAEANKAFAHYRW